MGLLPPSVDRDEFKTALAQVIEEYARRETEERTRKLEEAKRHLQEADEEWERAWNAFAAAQGTSPERLIELRIRKETPPCLTTGGPTSRCRPTRGPGTAGAVGSRAGAAARDRRGRPGPRWPGPPWPV